MGPSMTSSSSTPLSKAIRIRNAREHNLKSISVDIPRDQLVVERVQGRTWLRITPSALE